MNKQLITVIKEPVGIVIKPPAFVPRNYMIVETGSGDWTARTPNNEIIDYAPTAILAEWLCIRHAADNLHKIAAANGYVKLEPGQCVVQAHPFTDEEVNYLLSAIEAQKCADCRETCSQERCIYLALRTKLNAIRTALDASGVGR